MYLLAAVFVIAVFILVVTSISLGISLSRTMTGRSRSAQAEGEDDTGENNKHLHRIEREIREGTCIGIIAISIAAIVAAGTLDTDIWWKLFLLVAGGMGIVYSIVRYLRGR